MAYAYKHTRRNILSLMRNHTIKDECFIHLGVSTGYDEIKVDLDETVSKRINSIDQMFNFIDQRRNCF